MSENQRQHPRQILQVDVELRFLEDDPRRVKTRDISQGGLFMRLSNSEHYTMGEMVSLSYKNPLQENRNTDKDGIIVRLTDDGIAVAFIEIADF